MCNSSIGFGSIKSYTSWGTFFFLANTLITSEDVCWNDTKRQGKVFFFFPEVRLCIITAVLAFCFFFIWGTFKKEPPTIRAQPCLVPRPLHSASQGLCVSGHVLRWFTSPTGCPRFNLVQRRVLSLAEKQLLSPLTLDFLKMFSIILLIYPYSLPKL